MSPKLEHGLVIEGNCIDVMANLPENGFEAVVCDPPYTVGDWDTLDAHNQTAEGYQAWCQDWAEQARHVLPPGGHLLAFSSAQDHHRMWSGIEDAGFEIRDTLAWHYGSGMPKGNRLKVFIDDDNEEAIEKWGDWRGLLKPATEFIVLARHPPGGSATAAQLEHGTGNLNVEDVRVPYDDENTMPRETVGGPSPDHNNYNTGGDKPGKTDYQDITGGKYNDGEAHGRTDMMYEPDDYGRYPANALFSPMAAMWLDAQTGELESGDIDSDHEIDSEAGGDTYGGFAGRDAAEFTTYGDSGGASRFFYCPKASKDERTLGGRVDNDHKTVKPIDLMAWLVRLVTAEGQRVLDPFCGSGSTLLACEHEDRVGVGIEREPGHAETARRRAAAFEEWAAGETDNGSGGGGEPA